MMKTFLSTFLSFTLLLTSFSSFAGEIEKRSRYMKKTEKRLLRMNKKVNSDLNKLDEKSLEKNTENLSTMFSKTKQLLSFSTFIKI